MSSKFNKRVEELFRPYQDRWMKKKAIEQKDIRTMLF